MDGVVAVAQSGWGRARSRIERMPTGKLIALALLLSLVLTVSVEIAAAQRYHVAVRVTEGGALGINPLDDSLDFGDMPRGTGQTRFVTLTNGGDRPAYIVVLALGSARSLIKIDRTRFQLKGGETVQLGFEMKVPPSARVKGYSGTVHIFRFPYIAL